jgi:hypothetical protein
MQMTLRRIGMKLGKRPKRKQDQALDVVASAAKTWSEWQLAKRAGKGVRKGAKKAAAMKPSKSPGVKGAVTGKPGRIAGIAALVGGVGAVVARKLKGGGGDAPAYTPPKPHEPAAPPPSPVATPSPTAAAITHDAPPPPSLQAPPPASLQAAPDPPAIVEPNVPEADESDDDKKPVVEVKAVDDATDASDDDAEKS